MATTESTPTFDRIAHLDRDGLIELWRTLPAPDPAAVEGEYAPWIPPYFEAAFRGPSGLDGGPGLLLGIYSTNTPAAGFTPVADTATGRTRHEVFGLRGPTAPWVGVDDPSAESR